MLSVLRSVRRKTHSQNGKRQRIALSVPVRRIEEKPKRSKSNLDNVARLLNSKNESVSVMLRGFHKLSKAERDANWEDTKRLLFRSNWDRVSPM
jgi:hypothetical protein